MNTFEQSELYDARKGTLFFLSHIKIERDQTFDSGLISNFASSTSVINDLKKGTSSLVGSFDAGNKALDRFKEITAPIKQLFVRFFDALVERMVSLYGDNYDVIEWVSEFSTWAASELCGSLADLLPGWGYVQNAIEIYEACKKSVVASINWIQQAYTGWGVDLLKGGPSVMVEALYNHHVVSLAGGLKDIALTSITTGLKLAGDATAGIGSIIGTISGILQRITNMVGYAIQRFMLNRVIDQSANQYRKLESTDNYDYFVDWFRTACICTPIISALTLSSGLTAHPYRFLSMAKKNGEVISQKSFDDGVAYIDKLKDIAAEYLKEYQDCYKVRFCSDNLFVSNRLEDTLK